MMEKSDMDETSGPTSLSHESREKQEAGQDIKVLLKDYNKEFLEFIKVVDQTVPNTSQRMHEDHRSDETCSRQLDPTLRELKQEIANKINSLDKSGGVSTVNQRRLEAQAVMDWLQYHSKKLYLAIKKSNNGNQFQSSVKYCRRMSEINKTALRQIVEDYGKIMCNDWAIVLSSVMDNIEETENLMIKALEGINYTNQERLDSYIDQLRQEHSKENKQYEKRLYDLKIENINLQSVIEMKGHELEAARQKKEGI